MRDKSGKKRKYSIDMIKAELAEFGFAFLSKLDGSIHFEKYHSPYQWKIHNNDLRFDDIEKGCTLNFRNIKQKFGHDSAERTEDRPYCV